MLLRDFDRGSAEKQRDPVFLGEIRKTLAGKTAQQFLDREECGKLLKTFEITEDDTVVWRKIWVLYCLVVWLETRGMQETERIRECR